jgi:ATP-binding cassette subfamily B protein
MDEYLPTLPLGLDTVVGENAAGLSEGQSQRLAIARAVLGGAPILLLDECTSALDEATEKTVLERLRNLKERTCIAVTHRPAAREIADRTLMMADGRITVGQMEK